MPVKWTKPKTVGSAPRADRPAEKPTEADKAKGKGKGKKEAK